MAKNQHVVPTSDGWAIKGEGNSQPSARFRTQKEALDKAREIANSTGSEVVTHGRDGRIRERNRYGYGKGAFPPEG